MMGHILLSMVESRARGCVDQVFSENICVLSTQTQMQTTHDMSRNTSDIQLCNLDINDERLHSIRAIEHAEHARQAIKHQLKQNNKKNGTRGDRKAKESNRLRAELIDANARALEHQVRSFSVQNRRKRKAEVIVGTISKRRRVTFIKYKVRCLKCPTDKSVIKCFDRRGGRLDCAHTHQWWAIV